MSVKWACFVSGGIDSIVLLDRVHAEAKQLGVPLSVVHFNFHLRGEESHRDENFVRNECARRGLRFILNSVPLEKGSGIQNRARQIRWEFLSLLDQEKKFTDIFWGHQADDQLETFLMRLMRGAGLKGLRGISPLVVLPGGMRLRRPLLKMPRIEIEKYACERGLSFVEDSSNSTDHYRRNHLRHHVVPALKKKNSQILEDVGRMCERFQKVWQELEPTFNGLKLGSGKPILVQNYFAQISVLRFEWMRWMLAQKGFVQEFGQKHFKEIEAFLKAGKNGKKVYGNATLILYRNQFVVAPFFFKLGKALQLNPAKASHELVLRPVQPGDRFHPYGRPGSKKISDYWTDLKIPPWERAGALVLCDGEKVAALLGHEIDNEYRVLNWEAPILHLEFNGTMRISID